MQPHYLFPHKYKKLGWIILIPALLIGAPVFFTNYEPDWLTFRMPALITEELLGSVKLFTMVENNIMGELIGITLIVGALLVAFSKQDQEDEMIAKIRLESLVWAVYFNYAILLFAVIFVFDFAFLYVMLINIVTILLFFIIRFHWQIAKLNKTTRYEE